AEKSFAKMERSEKGGDFLSKFLKKYYLFLAELLALNNSDNREDLQKTCKSLDITRFNALFRVSRKGDTFLFFVTFS
ncbi:hypothetical protein, partial [Bacillus pseudomycoides]